MNKSGRFLIGLVVITTLFAAIAHAADFSAPTIPQGVSASLTQSYQVSVSWSPSTDDTDVVGYYVYRNGGMVANTPGIPYYVDTPPAGYYAYSVSAYDANGNVSAQSISSTGVTVVSDTMAPSAPSNFSAVPSSSTVALSWDPSTDNLNVVGYYVYRNGFKIATNDPITANSFTDTGLSGGSGYTYSVAAYDAAGNISLRSAALTVKTIFDVTPPSTPTRLYGIAVSQSEIDLTWQASTDNVGIGGYAIYRDGNFVANTDTSGYKDFGVGADTTYGYQVYAYDTVGNNSQQAAAVSVRTPSPDLVAPSAPANLFATPLSSSQVNLTWRASSDNVAVNGYYIWRDGNQIGTAVTPVYVDIGLSTSTSYQYAVTAYDAAGNISPQGSVLVKTLSYDPGVPVVTPSTQTSGVPDTTSKYGSVPDATTVPTITNTTGLTIGANLYYGLRTNDVKTLQTILIAQGYLGADYGTGFYGSLTQGAVQKFQCAQNIVCSGSPATTGWGSVGPRTRKAINGY